MPDIERNELYERIKSEQESTAPIRCSDLVCKDCEFRFDDSNPMRNGRRNGYGRMRGPTSKCSKFAVKPTDVLLGGNCPKYSKSKRKG